MVTPSREHGRLADRFRMNAPYTRVVVRPERAARPANPAFSAQAVAEDALEGHAYDISASGLRFELDQALDEGTPVELEIQFPGSIAPVHTHAHVVRVFDHNDDPGPCRMAAQFDSFAQPEQQVSLRGALECGLCGRVR